MAVCYFMHGGQIFDRTTSSPVGMVDFFVAQKAKVMSFVYATSAWAAFQKKIKRSTSRIIC